MATMHATAVGIFRDRSQAQRAVQELRAAGFGDDQIGVAGRSEAVEVEVKTGESHAAEGALAGAAAGAGLGGLWALGIAAGVLPAVGPVIAGGLLASILASAAGGAAAGSVLGTLVGLGIPEEEAQYYDEEFRSGRTVVTVRANGRYDQAAAILRRCGGYDYQGRAAAATQP